MLSRYANYAPPKVKDRTRCEAHKGHMYHKVGCEFYEARGRCSKIIHSSQ